MEACRSIGPSTTSDWLGQSAGWLL